jgi:hypothetical protein
LKVGERKVKRESRGEKRGKGKEKGEGENIQRSKRKIDDCKSALASINAESFFPSALSCNEDFRFLRSWLYQTPSKKLGRAGKTKD